MSIISYCRWFLRVVALLSSLAVSADERTPAVFWWPGIVEPVTISGFGSTLNQGEKFNATDQHANSLAKIDKIAEQYVAAIVIHCAMHSYRAAKVDDRREFLDVSSFDHERPARYPVASVLPGHPIMAGFPVNGWATPEDELYVIERTWPNTQVLATSVGSNGESVPVFWTNSHCKSRIFGTTFGHTNDTFTDKTFLDVLARAISWVIDVDGN